MLFRSSVDYRRYLVKRGRASYFTEGLAGYDPALKLALATVVNDAPQNGDVRVASTEVSDAAAFARVQAGVLDNDNARSEAYLRNNEGRFGESAEFFDTLSVKEMSDPSRRAEFYANAGLQQSNLSNFAAALGYFQRARAAVPQSDGVTQRLIRNNEAINWLNQHDPARALSALAEPMEPVEDGFDPASLRTGFVSAPLSEQINRENASLRQLGGIDAGLTPFERAAAMDAQSEELRGVALRQQGKYDAARVALKRAEREISSIRDGRLVSAAWLLSEIQLETALVDEAEGNPGQAESSYNNAIRIYEQTYPSSPQLLAAKARKAAWLGRSGKKDEAIALFGEVVDQAQGIPDSSASFRDLLGSYFALLADRNDADAAAALFTGVQSLQRPGVARTQAVLAREMSEGNDEASAMFRLSVSRSREILRTETEVARYAAIADPKPQDIENLAAARASLADLKQEQTVLQSKLAQFPRYKVLAPQTVTLADLQGALKSGEAYYKLTMVGDAAYAIMATHDSAQVFHVDRTRPELEKAVSELRDSIVVIENGAPVNYPFNLELSHSLYTSLFGPTGDALSGVKHLIFEPDGPLLQLPPELLVTDQASVDRYNARMTKPNADDFDFTGTSWLGRGREVSIAVSPRSFLDVRAIAPSRAQRAYLGLGENAVPQSRPASSPAGDCDWPLATWQAPISPTELYLAQNILGKQNSDVLTGATFSDSTLLSDRQLSDYRILHFATHGLVTAPSPQCVARPALVTSFGDSGSDGLLSFREVFDLKLDADFVILSACDTAGMATVAASREAGVATGGNYALDGLVRAFVGAGARSVIASHWPVSDEFDATKKLMTGLFGAKPGEPVGMALSQAQEKLMDDPLTSHPFYWAPFVILGDGAKPLIDTGKPGVTAAKAAESSPAS